MALSNLFGWNTKKETAAAAACGTACGTACGAGGQVRSGICENL